MSLYYSEHYIDLDGDEYICKNTHKPTNKDICTYPNLWEEYTGDEETNDSFNNLTYEERMKIFIECYGSEEENEVDDE